MWFLNLLRERTSRTLLPGADGARRRRSKPAFRPRLEHLEARDLPTAGFLDQGFGIHGQVIVPDPGRGQQMAVKDVAVQTDGKIVVAGTIQGDTNKDFGLMRFNADGSVDTSFGNSGQVQTNFGFDDVANSLAIQPDGKIVVAGSSAIYIFKEFTVARYNSDGTADGSFGPDGHVTTSFQDIGGLGGSEANSVALQPDGKIVAAGSFHQSATQNTYFGLARYNSDGSLDNSFGGVFGGPGEVLTDFPSGGSFDDASANSIAIQADGRIVAVGNAVQTTPELSTGFALARYYADGTPDFD
jgi:uncharacterized delta-60 repeat protein